MHSMISVACCYHVSLSTHTNTSLIFKKRNIFHCHVITIALYNNANYLEISFTEMSWIWAKLINNTNKGSFSFLIFMENTKEMWRGKILYRRLRVASKFKQDFFCMKYFVNIHMITVSIFNVTFNIK